MRVRDLHSLWDCEPHRDLLPGKGVVRGVDQHDPYLVFAGRQFGYVDCVAVARIRPPPEVVDLYVQMADTRRYVQGARPEHRCDVQVLHAVLSPKDAQGSPSASGGSTISLGAGSFSMVTYGEAPRNSLALCAKAPVASTAPATTE